MTIPPGWSTQKLAQFLVSVSAFKTEASAALGAVECLAHLVAVDAVAAGRDHDHRLAVHDEDDRFRDLAYLGAHRVRRLLNGRSRLLERFELYVEPELTGCFLDLGAHGWPSVPLPLVLSLLV